MVFTSTSSRPLLFRPSRILFGLAAVMIVFQQVAIVFFSVTILFHGAIANNTQLHGQVQEPNTKHLPTQLLNCHGFCCYVLKLGYVSLNLPSCSVIEPGLLTYPPTLSSMHVPNTLKLTFTSFMTWLRKKILIIWFILSKDQLANIFMKPLSSSRFGLL
jgi:hypothetical protein